MHQRLFCQMFEGATMEPSSVSPLLAIGVTRLLSKELALDMANVGYIEMLETLSIWHVPTAGGTY